jgi:hypothetical protein
MGVKKPKTTTKTTRRGVVKKKVVSNGVKLKQKTKPSGQQKIKGRVKTKNKNYGVRSKGVTASKRNKL